MDKLRDTDTFVAVVEAGSFTKAAEITGVSPVMIGRRITQIEDRLGGKLFERSTRNLSLTPEGERYHRYAVNILKRLRTAERLVSDGRDYATGGLIVTCSSGFGRQHVAPNLPEFMRANPDVQVSLNLSDRLVDLRTGYDIGIRTGAAVDRHSVVTRLHPNPMVVCAAPSYCDRNGVPATPEGLLQHACLIYNGHGGQSRGWNFVNDGQPIVIRPTGALTSNDGSMLTRWAIAGFGIAWRPLWEVGAALARGDLVSILDEFAAPPQDIVAAYLPQDPVPLKIELFVSWLKNIYSTPEYWRRSRDACS